MYRVTWEGRHADVASCEQVDQLLDRLEAEFAGDKAILVLIEETSTGDTLKVGVGRERTVLDYVPGSLEPPYYVSVGNPGEAGTLTFRYDGEVTEIPAKNGISRALGREAVRHFCRTGRLSESVHWEMD
jgi:hypothetical protein